MSSVTNASRISPPAGVGLPVLGPNPNAAAAAREKGPSGVMVKELMLTDIALGSDIPWPFSDNKQEVRRRWPPARDKEWIAAHPLWHNAVV